MQITKFENKNLNIQKLQIMRKKIQPVLQIKTDSSNAENREANVSLAAAKETSIEYRSSGILSELDGVFTLDFTLFHIFTFVCVCVQTPLIRDAGGKSLC